MVLEKKKKNKKVKTRIREWREKRKEKMEGNEREAAPGGDGFLCSQEGRLEISLLLCEKRKCLADLGNA